jgi:hypothetical protein
MRSLLAAAALLSAAVPGCREASRYSRLALEPEVRQAGASTKRGALLHRALPAVRARVDAICFGDGEVTLDEGRIVVRVARTTHQKLARLTRELARRSEIELRLLGRRRGERPSRLDGRAVTSMALIGAASPARARVVVRLSKEAREQLAWVTATNLGSRLVLTIDGELSAAGMITRRLDAGEWRARPAAPETTLEEGREVTPLSYRQLLALDRRLRSALTVPLRRARSRQ